MIRKANSEDISRIAEIIVFGKRVAYRSIFHNDQVSFHELQVIHLLQEYQDTPSLLDNILVFDDGIIKGVINREYCDGAIEIHELYVEPFFIGNGIGRELTQYVISEAKETNVNKIYLWVIKDNLSARKFYEMNGFHETGETCLIEGTSKFDMYYEMILSHVNKCIPNDGYFTKIKDEPFPTLESLKSLYIEYGGDEYCLWHDYGDAYIDACKKFQITQKEKDMWKKDEKNEADN